MDGTSRDESLRTDLPVRPSWTVRRKSACREQCLPMAESPYRSVAATRSPQARARQEGVRTSRLEVGRIVWGARSGSRVKYAPPRSLAKVFYLDGHSLHGNGSNTDQDGEPPTRQAKSPPSNKLGGLFRSRCCLPNEQDLPRSEHLTCELKLVEILARWHCLPGMVPPVPNHGVRPCGQDSLHESSH
jgi:hypothetical protein